MACTMLWNVGCGCPVYISGHGVVIKHAAAAMCGFSCTMIIKYNVPCVNDDCITEGAIVADWHDGLCSLFQ